MVNSSDFSKRLQMVFDYYQLNASSFAEKIGVGRASISHILSGRNKPSLDFVMKVISEFPEVELYWLLNGRGSFPKSTHSSPASSSFSKETVPTPTNKNEHENQSESSTLKQDEDHPFHQVTTASNKEISKVLILYKDGSFDSFTPNE